MDLDALEDAERKAFDALERQHSTGAANLRMIADGYDWPWAYVRMLRECERDEWTEALDEQLNLEGQEWEC